MNRDIVILVDDHAKIRESFSQSFEDEKLDMELMMFASIEEYKKAIDQPEIKQMLKCIVFDLSTKHNETGSIKYAISEFIEEQYVNNRIPIFIHSAYLTSYEEYEFKGTVFKIEKSANSPTEICRRIGLMKKSNFLNIFCFGGELDRKIMSEIHNAFVEQFKYNEIEEIIKSIESATSEDDFAKRTVAVFERLAIRAVFQNLMNAKQIEEDTIEEVKVNAIEHYYRRARVFNFWTGDIFEENKDGNLVVIVTPRCNIGHKSYDQLLLCRITKISSEIFKKFQDPAIADSRTKETKGEKALRSGITDAPNSLFPGERYRFLPKTPQFEGGVVDFKTVFSLFDQELENNYKYRISLVDDLTNDVVRKLSAYLLRGGISETEYKEAHFYIKENQSSD